MKKLLVFLLSIVLLSTTFFWSACLKTEDEGWTDDEKASYEEVINLQNEVENNLDEWFLTMDSLDAIKKAQQFFADAPSVSEAIVNSQGIAVQYANGMRGGLYLNPLDNKTERNPDFLLNDLETNHNVGLKSIVNKRKMILINPHYHERSYYTDQIYSIHRNNLRKAGIDLSTFYKNEEATVNRFTELSGYGIIQIYSHGWAWPKENNITDIYLLTGETANDATSKKYWDELKTGNIPVAKIAGSNNSYLVSERFIENYNDFSKDTVLFYGGFCYSFLGDWPDLQKSFADGVYVGFDWSVYTYRNANWSVNLVALMSDTSKSEPMNMESWMNDSGMEKSYWDATNERTVHIYYTGDGTLTLWGDVSVKLIALSDDGTPVTHPGEAGVAYPFKCEVVSDVSDLEYVWDIGDGSSPVTASNSVNITWSENGSYVLKVDVKDKSNGNIIGTAQANVTIGDSGSDDVIGFVTSCTKVNAAFIANIQYSPPYDDNNISSHVEVDWSGLSFNGYLEEDDLGNFHKYTISGTLSNDGQKVSYVAKDDYKWIVGEQVLGEWSYTITVNDYPLSMYYPEPTPNEDPFASYGSIYSGVIDVQQYVSNVEGYTIDNGVTYTVTGVDWNSVTQLNIVFSK